MSAPRLVRFVVKPVVFAAALVPLGVLAREALSGGLGVNPIEKVTHWSGDSTLSLLLLTLAVTPLRAVTGWNVLVRFRRMLGLFAFFYGVLHLATYLVLDKFFDWPEIFRDLVHRRFIIVGALGLALLVPLAVTSTAGMIRRMGGRAWRALHRLVYVSAAAGVVHYWWLVKADVSRPRVYAVVLGSLLAARLIVAWRRRPQATSRLSPGASTASRQSSPAEATGR
jgi:methionine sulfoxide reductase heme-binding subunit